MAAFGEADVVVANGSATTVDTADINVTGTDLCLIMCGGEGQDASPTLTTAWDPDGNDEAPTGTITTVSQGTFVDITIDYLDDPTPADAPVRCTFSAGTLYRNVGGAFFTGAGDIVATDFDTDGFATNGTTFSSEATNVVTGDMVVDYMMIEISDASLTAGADQTSRAEANATYNTAAISTQDGVDGGVMSWSGFSSSYGGAHIALRIPDAAASVVITDVDTDETWDDGDTGLVITGTGFV